MNDKGLDPTVRSILEAARDRSGRGDERLSIHARSLEAAIERAESDGRVPIVAEVKPTSPTTDGVRTDDPVDLAQQMVDGGATAISVLTEPDHFDGSTEALARVREAVSVPVLRKDFVVREEQLDAVEADLVLLIARFVDELDELVSAALDRGLQPIVEVHDRAELRRALATETAVVGINNRDLASLQVDLTTVERVAAVEDPSLRQALDDVTLVAESGVSTPADVRRMREAGADALLVGSAIMDGDVAANTRALVHAERAVETDDADTASEVDAS
ncbi:indole-3-glycerol phosphate synthase [Halovivax asiaticus JCM 14624]|uniref:Indole-3-glycerol phosphate synthase n=1 Tax=Halovivax asiaticus JCM 14624 TaxID=1227490 RepID=M0BBP0_9EURY|nr:indole-3-glycerol phosphate synthase [Halovivax asiaticus]ELZ08240.1 indole-3-glycerol phosphate synthase [Halovivax asiaticus JCM 14624]